MEEIRFLFGRYAKIRSQCGEMDGNAVVDRCPLYLPIADIGTQPRHVRFVPIADIGLPPPSDEMSTVRSPFPR
jgi:hypothetical protein